MSILKTEKITKIYPGTKALDQITVAFDSGKVHAFIGKNGSGKSTLVKIFAGAIQPTEGSLYLDDEKIVLHSPPDAIERGIATVYQELRGSGILKPLAVPDGGDREGDEYEP